MSAWARIRVRAHQLLIVSLETLLHCVNQRGTHLCPTCVGTIFLQRKKFPMSESSRTAASAAVSTLPRPATYSAALRLLHWLSALCMFIVIPLAWYMTELDRHDPHRVMWFTLHKSIGLTVLVLTLIRITTRLSGTLPALPARIPAIERTLAHIGHGLLYLILLGMPISGYLNSYAGGHPIDWFWLFQVPAMTSPDRPLAHLAGQTHRLLAWATYALIAGHVLAVVYHQLVQRVDVLGRMTGRATPDAENK